MRKNKAIGITPPTEGLALEVKRRETAAAVAQMRNRLKSMGILEATVTAPPQRGIKGIPQTGNNKLGLIASSPVMPPLPPTISERMKPPSVVATAKSKESGYETSSTVTDSGDEGDNKDPIAISQNRESSINKSSIPELQRPIIGNSPAKMPMGHGSSHEHSAKVKSNESLVVLQENEMKVKETAVKCRTALRYFLVLLFTNIHLSHKIDFGVLILALWRKQNMLLCRRFKSFWQSRKSSINQ